MVDETVVRKEENEIESSGDVTVVQKEENETESSGNVDSENDPESLDNIPEIDLSGDGGVLKKVLKIGDPHSQPSPECKVKVHYTGKKEGGEKFDSSYDRKEAFEFILFNGSVIEAFDLCVISMKKGEKAYLSVQSGYAIQPEAGGAGPMMAKLNPGQKRKPGLPEVPLGLGREDRIYFEIELIDWYPADLSPQCDGGIIRHVIIRPGSYLVPNDGATVDVHWTGVYEGRIYDDRDVTFVVGETSEDEVIMGIQEAITRFGVGETSRLVIQPEYAFDKKGHEKHEIPPNAVVEYIVSMNKFTRVPDAWKLKTKESFDEAHRLKRLGTYFLKNGKYKTAVKLYERAKTYRVTVAAEEFKGNTLLNIALCHLKLKNFEETIQTCKQVFEIDPKNIKAFYRRGLAYLGANEPEKALEDFEKAHELYPLNQSITNQIKICKYEMQSQNAADKKLYAKMLK